MKNIINNPFKLAAVAVFSSAFLFSFVGCGDDTTSGVVEIPLAEGIYGPLGAVIPTATDEQKEIFELGLAVSLQRFSPEEGLGPLFNVAFCSSCHEKPTPGGSAGHYRNFFIQGQVLEDGSIVSDDRGGVVAAYSTSVNELRPDVYEDTNLMVQRNAIPFFGAGLIAELPDAAILANEDPDDLDGDGISGRANYDQGFVGRFGRKSQTVNLEGFIRGPLFNHLGVTTDPLGEEYLDRLPVPSGRLDDEGNPISGQVAAPAEPLTDLDDAPDPEMTEEELFHLVSFAQLLAAPLAEPLTEQSEAGLELFRDVGCDSCHVETLAGPRGRIAIYSDLLLHDMGEELADGLRQGVAEGNEFRTQPLWGIVSVGPYLHDGRADTLHDAILYHGGEATGVRDSYAALTVDEQALIIEFLESLGGRDQFTTGLVPPNTPVPPVDELGGPFRELTAEEEVIWLEGRELYDRDVLNADGLGPLFNGDGCRACHFDPMIGGSGPIDVNAMRFGEWTEDGEFISPDPNTILQKLAVFNGEREGQSSAHNVFEPRQTPLGGPGLGLIELIPDENIIANEDPDDLDGDGISGRVHYTGAGQVGRLSWKGGVPSTREFVRDGLSNEVGLMVPEEEGFFFGFISDEDDVPDPEVSSEQIDAMAFFMNNMAPLYPVGDNEAGRTVFADIGCESCHMNLEDADGELVMLYSDLLLHDVAPENYVGIPDGDATEREFRTPPLWGLSRTGPYMHDGFSSDVEAAIMNHFAEGETSRLAYEALSDEDRENLLDFLNQL